ncbi:MAG: 30S ribosomal protein S11 [Patescibacteria group bacterium]|nr:30S ribosomal protein S11 [Patescibacteria group bacterium]
MADENNKVSSPAEAAAPQTDVASKIKGSKKKKVKAKVVKGKIYINSTYNNTIIAVTDLSGNVVVWGSAGKIGFKGSKKSTPYAGQKTMEDVLARAKERGLSEVDVFIKGIGSGRESAVRALQGSSLTVLTIKDQTPIPHGGVRPKKPRRV